MEKLFKRICELKCELKELESFNLEEYIPLEDTFEKYYSKDIIFDALHDFSDGKVSGQFMSLWLDRYSDIILCTENSNFAKQEISFYDELKMCIAECLGEISTLIKDNKLTLTDINKEIKQAMLFIEAVDTLLNNARKENLVIYYKNDVYEDSHIPKIVYLVIFDEEKKYCLWQIADINNMGLKRKELKLENSEFVALVDKLKEADYSVKW